MSADGMSADRQPGVSALAAVDVSYSYPIGPPAIDGVSLDIAAGRRLCLLGGNGSGKSTLLLLLNGSLRPASGEIRVGGEAPGYRRAALNSWRRQVGLVLQDPDDQLFSASVFEDVSFGPLNIGLSDDDARSRVEGVLKELGLTDLSDRPAHLLSFGQRKRVAIAGVAAMEPDIMLLDEPLAGLDPTAAEEVLDTLHRLEQRGTTVVLTTHNVDLALAWADEAALMSGGRLIARGDIYDTLADPELCARTRLRRPSVIDLTDALIASGTIDADAQPRTPAELAALVTR